MPAPLPIASETRAVVYTKTTWAADWIEQPLLEATSFGINVAPAHSTATLMWRFGRTIQPEIGDRPADLALTDIQRGDFLGNYVRIEFVGQVWWGVIQDLSTEEHGLLDGNVPSGIESYTAFGLTWFLDQGKPILQSKIKNGDITATIERAIPFNGGTDGTQQRRSVAWKNYDSTAKCFSDASQSDPPVAWKASTAIAYVLDNFFPRDAAGEEIVPFELATDAASFLDYELPLTDYDGLTPWQLIARLIDRKRGLLLTTRVVDDKIQLVVRSQNKDSITLPSGSVIPANPDTRTYNFDNALNLDSANSSETLLSKYDQVICLGERAGSVFTVRPVSNFEPDWTPAQQTTYNVGASAETGYSTLSDADKGAANSDRRAADDLLPVFSWWRASRTWNWRSDTDPTSASAPYAFPTIDDDGTVDLGTPAPVQRAGLRVMPYLPFRTSIDYVPEITTDTDGTDAADADFLPPLLLLKAPVIRSSTTDAGWVHCERLNAAATAGSESTKRPYQYTVDLALREDQLGLILQTQGAPQHYLCQDLFSPTSSFEAIPSGEGFNSTDWLATIYVQQDQYCRVQYPLKADLPSLDLIRPLVLRFAGAFLDYVVPGTILGVKAGALLKTVAGGYVRDDRKRLKDVARMAYEWHGKTRRVLNLRFRGITAGFEVGHLITKIGSGPNLREVNTAITSVQYDLKGGRMQVQTSFGEMDFTT